MEQDVKHSRVTLILYYVLCLASASLVARLALARQIEENCPRLAGTFEAIGTPLAGYPSFYRIRGWALAVELMLGVSIPQSLETQVTRSEIIDNDHLEVLLWIRDGQIKRHPLVQQNDRTACDQGNLIIVQERDMVAEGTLVHSRTTRTLSRGDHGSLRIDVKIEPTGKLLWVIPIGMPVEEYRASFALIGP